MCAIAILNYKSQNTLRLKSQAWVELCSIPKGLWEPCTGISTRRWSECFSAHSLPCECVSQLRGITEGARSSLPGLRYVVEARTLPYSEIKTTDHTADKVDAMSSVIIKIDGVEVAMVSPGLNTTVVNLKLPQHNHMSLRVSQILAGLVCVIFCWTSPYFLFGLWTGIPLIVTGVFYILSQSLKDPGWLLASSIMNILSFLLGVVAIILFSIQWDWRWNNLEMFVLVGLLGGMFCSLQTFAPLRLRHTSQEDAKTLVDTKPLLDPQPPAYGEKSLTLDTD
ncbi:uncharacterized protein LOC144757594 [Lissotriton helveticus]